MPREKEILEKLYNSVNQGHNSFIDLGMYILYLIDARLNFFKGENGQWAIVGERLDFNPQGNCIYLDIHYFGNCIHAAGCNGSDVNWYSVSCLLTGIVFKPLLKVKC